MNNLKILADANCLGLLFNCCYEDEVIDCPLRKIREMPCKKIIDLVVNMPKSAIFEIVEIHRVCSSKQKKKYQHQYSGVNSA